ncbi:MAG: cofactor-independent phosphoglycerate mutase [Phycisphaerae bacterium]|nr:cofactor-independent phosphoglycerate mutase [Phycisphaerae bacterium]NIR62423.1 cofactor-independent phosphoglycerate mutase [candidate division Zixibacteria bacterium]NIP55792.1 cofactor-independent phosphoglycerate mutase [Phycisphaerae bacterium]NIS50280.1 cofactor-independent phosphoglycerate mutase [Phycisphaerae bacterium]NIU08025.1 cofactor-independent phosphoglycerate mutase [Phycisphaerae bacterium]
MTKYVIIVPDGAADKPLEQFDGRTVLEASETPNIDKISTHGRQGLAKTIPDGMEAGSDIAQMSLLGYDPRKFYSGRAPIEAAARNIKLSADDWVFRCNLITIADGKMADHSAGHISTEEARALIKELNEQLSEEKFQLYPGVSYRHLLVFKGLDFDIQTYPPHDFVGQKIEKILPRGKGAEMLIDLMARSQQLFSNHDINKVRKDLGENQVSSIWLWGEGKKTLMESFQKRFGLKGATITAVDLARGLSKLIGFDVIDVPGATGFVDTNYEGKGLAAIEGLEKYDLIFVHIEAPDEASHNGNAEMKKKAIEQIDKYIVGPVLEALQEYKSWRILVMPDHPTPVSSKAHSSEPVPFAMAGDNISGILHKTFSESNAAESGFRIDNGFEIMEYFLKS